MSKYEIYVRDEAGKARLVVRDRVLRAPVGFLVSTWVEYEGLLRVVLGTIARECTAMLGEHLGKLLWEQAQRSCNDDTEEAKRRLLSVGVTGDWLTNVSAELGRRLGERMVSHTPNIRPGTGTSEGG